MGFDVERLVAPSVRLRLGGNKTRVWVTASALLALPAARREKHLTDELGFDKNVASKIVKALESAKTEDEALRALEAVGSGKGGRRAPAGTLVVQPGPERRRTSSHYTPRSLCEPIVARTLEPLIRALGERPRSEDLLQLVICDPAMGSGAFLVAACRYLADQVVAAWTRESADGLSLFDSLLHGSELEERAARGGKAKLALLADAKEDVVNDARRLVAQRCLYGVDKNPFAVELARLSLWLVTLAKDEPFTFVDHALRHGDSLVGLNFEQIRAFHWKPEKQLETTSLALRQALDEAIGLRQQILEFAGDSTREGQARKYLLLSDARDALDRVRLIADLVIGAFFKHDKDKDRGPERDRRLDLVEQWLAAKDTTSESALEAPLREMQAELWRTQAPFHWMLEFPEVFTGSTSIARRTRRSTSARATAIYLERRIRSRVGR